MKNDESEATSPRGDAENGIAKKEAAVTSRETLGNVIFGRFPRRPPRASPPPPFSRPLLLRCWRADPLLPSREQGASDPLPASSALRSRARL